MYVDVQALSAPAALKYLQLGPLNYALVPHDAWGEQTISAIGRHFPLSFDDKRDVKRIIHLKRLADAGNGAIHEPFPAQEIRTILSEEALGLTWQQHGNVLNTVWHSHQTSHALWISPADDSVGILRFHLPWDLLLHDLAELGGGLIHAGMAVHNHHAWLFLAQPGGGKCTSLAKAPADWQVPADDAALICPELDGHWRLFPLLSWSTMLASPGAAVASTCMAPGTFTLGGMLILEKAAEVQFGKLSPVAAAAQIYCALTQYPAIFLCDHIHHEPFFRSACQLARQVPCWQLELPLGGDIWPGVAGLEGACGGNR